MEKVSPRTQKRILIYSLIFSPDGVSTAYLYNDLAKGFKEAGHEVVVLTTTPHFNPLADVLKKQPLKKRFFGSFYVSDFNGIKVYHIPLKKYKRVVLRLASFVYWHKMSFLVGLFLRKFDFILSPSPPLTNGFIAILLAKLKGAKVIYNVQEVYPDLLVNQGYLKSSFAIGFLKWLERFIYKGSHLVTTIDQSFYNTLLPRVKEKEKLKIIPNFVDTDLYKPVLDNDPLENHSLFKKEAGHLNVMYAGNIGEAQEWDLLLEVASTLRAEKITFWLIGEGAKKQYVEEQIKEQELFNMRLFPYQDRALMPALNLFADLHFISLAKKVEFEGFPSKTYTIMASARPILAVASEKTPLYEFLKGKDCALLFSQRDAAKISSSLKGFIGNQEQLKTYGSNGVHFIKQHYTKEVVVEKYLNEFHD